MPLEIKWSPDVCGCEVMQDRMEPDTHYEFIHKCEVHQGMSDVDARAAIVQLCIEKSNNGE